MPSRFVGHDMPRRIAFAPAHSTLVIINQDNVSDIYVAVTEEELRNIPFSAGAPQLNNGSIGIKIAAAGGQLTWVDYPGQLFGIASGGVGANGTLDTVVRVTPG